MAGIPNSAHSDKWSGPQGCHIRKFVKLRRIIGQEPIDGERLDKILAEDAAKRRDNQGKGSA